MTLANSSQLNRFLSLEEICHKVGGRLFNAPDDQLVMESVATDSRLVNTEQLFIAIKGERFDAHDFVSDLVGKAGAALVSKEIDCELPQIIVKDTLQALADLSGAWRKLFTNPLIALTGSNGKTTLKEMIAAILSKKGKVLATFGNLNNDIGMPLTLLRLRDEHDYAVIEMGANHFGEIDFLTKIAQPDVAVLNNAGAAHLEGFIDLEGVSRAKGEIFIGLGTQGIAVINADDTYADYWKGLNTDREIISFGIDGEANISGRLSSDGSLMISKGDKEVRVNLKLLGQHNAMNALAAAAAVTALGIELETIVEGLETMLPVKGRLAPVAGINNSQILDDTYNANPDSVVAALTVLAQRENTVFVLGDLGELGDNPEDVHRQIGEKARAVGINRMYCLGQHSSKASDAFGSNSKSFENMDELLNILKKDVNESLQDNITILVKGSRFMKMERVVEALSVENGENT